jgi:hypothetical protein
MNRLLKCIQFQLKGALQSTSWFLGIYLVIYLFLFVLLQQLISSSDNSSGSVNSGFFLAGAIFVFVQVSASYKPNFNYLLMFGNTRRNIFLSTVSASAALSVIMAVISVASQFVDNAITKTLSKNSEAVYYDLFSILYKSNVNTFTESLWFLAMFIVIFSLAMLYGAMAYRFGKVFITAFWVVLGLCLTVLPLTIPVLNGTNVYVAALKMYFCAGVSGGIMLAPVNFIITAIIFCAVTYVLSTRQSQVV